MDAAGDTATTRALGALREKAERDLKKNVLDPSEPITTGEVTKPPKEEVPDSGDVSEANSSGSDSDDEKPTYNSEGLPMFMTMSGCKEYIQEYSEDIERKVPRFKVYKSNRLYDKSSEPPRFDRTTTPEEYASHSANPTLLAMTANIKDVLMTGDNLSANEWE